MNIIGNNLRAIQQSILVAERKYERCPGSVCLVAASKKQPLEKIRMAYEAGQTRFAENYLQEALPKIQALADKSIEWHFIGIIQSNKTRKIAEHFAWAHCVNHINIAKRLSEQRPAQLPPLNICIEVNISHEFTKSGVNPHEVFTLAKNCLALPHLALRGLMTIPAKETTFDNQRQSFHQLAALQNELLNEGIALDTLSMGMSADFVAAIAEGATIVRIGELLFGKR